MLTIRHLTKQFYQKNGAVTVINDLSLEVKKVCRLADSITIQHESFIPATHYCHTYV